MDVGGSGSRLALERINLSDMAPRLLEGDGAQIGTWGSSAARVVAELTLAAFTSWPDAMRNVAAITLGVTGLSTVARDHHALRLAAASCSPGADVLLASDGVAAHAGALNGEAGAVVVAGTGSIAIGTDFATAWLRSDGWGHLLSDLGAGAWIGQQGLQAAMASHDGRPNGSQTLLDRAVEVLGPPPTWPARLYLRDDRAAVLGSFAPFVSTAAGSGDPIAERILENAGRHLAESLAAVLDPWLPARASYTGGIFHAHPALVTSFRSHFNALAPSAILEEPRGTPLEGGLLLARLRAAGSFGGPSNPPFWY